MGTMASANCSCGYARQLQLGGGMLDSETTCLFPICCRTCRAVQVANLIESPATCLECGGQDVVAYDAQELLGKAGEREVFSWRLAGKRGRERRLSDGLYFCPACRQMQLRFQDTGCWD